MDPITITVADATRALGIKKTKLYELISSGKLDTVKIGRRRLVKAASIRTLVDQAA